MTASTSGPVRALVTRPAEDAAPLADRLAGLGFEAVIEPMLSIHDVDDVDVDFTGVQALAFTSANGVRALHRHGLDGNIRKIPVFAVGPATAAAAREAGFETVSDAGGDAAALVACIGDGCDAAKGPILHIAGRVRAGDLVADLVRHGFEARRAVFYEAVMASALTPETRALIEGRAIGLVLIFSPRTARQFVTLVEDSGLTGEASSMCLAALSRSVADAASSLPWGAVRVASKPNEAALLETIADLAPGRVGGG